MSTTPTLQSDHAPGSCGCTEADICDVTPVIEQTDRHQSLPDTLKSRSRVLEVAPAPSHAALQHFSGKLEFETDCSDVNAAHKSGAVDFVLLDVRSAELYRYGHVPGALNIPMESISRDRMEEFPLNTKFVVYCAGPHCNGANKAAIRLAKLERPVKEMIGGVTGWIDEGLTLEKL